MQLQEIIDRLLIVNIMLFATATFSESYAKDFFHQIRDKTDSRPYNFCEESFTRT